MAKSMAFTGVWKRWVGIRTAGIAALVILLAVAALSYRSIRQLEEQMREESLIRRGLTAVELLQSRIKDSQRGMRGFVITGEPRYLQPYFLARGSVDRELADLRTLFSQSPDQLQNFARVESLIRNMLSTHGQIIELRSNRGFEAAQAEVKTGLDKQSMDELQQVVEEVRKRETASLDQGNRTIEAHARNTTVALALGSVIILGLLTSAYSLIRRKMDQYQEAEEKTEELNCQLQASNRDISRLHQSAEMLQSCQTSEEAYQVVRHSVERLLEAESGALFLMKDSKNYLESVSMIGSGYNGETIFPPEACWALRRGLPHQTGGTLDMPSCPHLKLSGKASALCIPLVAQGETLGVLTLLDGADHWGFDTPDGVPSKQKLALALSESVALSLANIKLREALRSQSICDSLTGLYNRRYMEETLERELRRAERKQFPLGFVMLDLDHFKQFNDTFGHEAGDLLLKEFSIFVQARIRKEDIFCRYGGEEFVLIFPETSLIDTVHRADQIRESLQHLYLIHEGRPLGAVTVSAGVSAYPDHGLVHSLLQVADAALYRAKSEGRNRVVSGQPQDTLQGTIFSPSDN